MAHFSPAPAARTPPRRTHSMFHHPPRIRARREHSTVEVASGPAPPSGAPPRRAAGNHDRGADPATRLVPPAHAESEAARSGTGAAPHAVAGADIGPAPAQARRTIFIGDIHGCRGEFEELLSVVEFAPGRDRLLLTGDAFTRGPDPLGVWRLIRATRPEMVLGNHETWLLPQLRAIAAGGPPDALKQTRGDRLQDLVPHVAELLPWLEALPLAIDEPQFLLVHAGINPDTGLAGSTPDELVYIRTWPPTGGIEGPRWHDHIDPGGKPIVFGHDAPAGLVIKRPPGAAPDARPYLVGLDSACVFGGHLTAYLLEENRIIQVPARRRWFHQAPP